MYLQSGIFNKYRFTLMRTYIHIYTTILEFVLKIATCIACITIYKTIFQCQWSVNIRYFSNIKNQSKKTDHLGYKEGMVCILYVERVWWPAGPPERKVSQSCIYSCVNTEWFGSGGLKGLHKSFLDGARPASLPHLIDDPFNKPPPTHNL